MAGIGFQLRKILNQETYSATIRAYLYSALISSGPWLITIVAIGIVGLSQARYLVVSESQVFRITIVYVYTFTLIFLGIFQMPLTRYLADLLFTGNTRLFLPTFIGALLLMGYAQAAFVLPTALYFSGWNLVYGLHVFIFYMGVSFTWLAMIFLSAARNYNAIVIAFFGGLLVSVGLGTLMGRVYGVDGYIAGYTIGRVVLFLLLASRVVKEFPSDLRISFDFLRYLRRYYMLIVIGFFYNVSIWIDKMVFWFGPYGQRVDSFLYACNFYDLPMYLAYLTIVPSMAIFLIRVETSFIGYYKAFYGAIVGKRSYSVIHSFRLSMVEHIKLSFTRLLKVQGIVTFLAFLVVPYLDQFTSWALPYENILRIGVLGAFCHVLLLIVSIYLLYFDFQKETLFLIGFFMVVNGALTYLSQRLGEAYFGYGYGVACIVSLVLGLCMLFYKLRHLEYTTFVGQPIN